MLILAVGLVAIIGIHLVPTMPSLRQRLVDRLGERKYKAIYTTIALIGLVLIIYGKANAAFVPLWAPPLWAANITQLIMLPALILVGAAYAPSNIKRFTRHPMLWGVVLWAIAHLVANGDLSSLMLFGGFGVYSLFAMWSANIRGAEKSTTRYPIGSDIKLMIIGIIIYAVMVFLHPYLFGVPATI